MKNQDELIAQITAIIEMGEKVLITKTSRSHSKPLVNERKFHDFRISALSYMSRIFGEKSVYYQSFRSEVSHPTASRTRRGLGMLNAALRALQEDWLETTNNAISATILTDILRLATAQLDLGHHGAATIIAAAVLEKQLGDICLARGLTIHNKIQGKVAGKKGLLQLVSEAYRKKLCSRQEYQLIISWLELHSVAAKGQGDGIEKEQIRKMIDGIGDFITDVSE